MTISKAQIEAQKRYDKKMQIRYSFKFHRVNDKDVIDKLKEVPSMNGYIRNLIRADIEKNTL